MDCRGNFKLAGLMGRNIAERRKYLGLTQDALAERLGISGAAMSRIESGRTSPKFSRLCDLAQALDCQVADLFRNLNEPLKVRLDTIEDMLKSLPTATQEDLVHLLVVAIQMVKKGNSATKSNED